MRWRVEGADGMRGMEGAKTERRGEKEGVFCKGECMIENWGRGANGMWVEKEGGKKLYIP